MLNMLALRVRVGNQRVFGVFLISAVFVLILRLLGPLTMRWDLSIQVEAAYRLVQGLGLTNAFTSQADLNQLPISERLTHFPPGLPLLIAGFLFFNIPLAIAFKIIYGLSTIIGWLGWAVIASHCLERPFKILGRSISVNLFIAALLPIFYTPPWMFQGTDIFLWAGIPSVLLLLASTSINGKPNVSVVQPGLLLAALFSVRYASVFLVLAALVIIVYADYPFPKSALKRSIVLVLPLFVVIVAMMLQSHIASGDEVNQISNSNLLETHGGRYLESTPFDWMKSSLGKIFYSLSNLFFITGISARNIDFLEAYPGIINDVLGLAFLILIIFCCLIFIPRKKFSSLDYKNKLLASVAIALMSFLVFSILVTFVIAYSPLIIKRYYLPIEPCFIFLVYAIALSTKVDISFKRLTSLFIVLFITHNLTKPIYYSFSLKDDFSIAQTVELSRISEVHAPLPKTPYPSNKLLVIHPESLEFMTTTERQEPNALFFVQSYPVYMGYMHFQNPQKFRRIPDRSFWENAYLSQPTKVYWVINEPSCPTICASKGNFNSDDPEVPISVLMSLPNLATVFISSDDQTRILFSELPSGYRFGQVQSRVVSSGE